MNGGHDLGGMHGLGPINPEPESSEPVFHAEWEKRVFGLNLAAGALGKWNLDISRYARERQHPADYLRHSYYENWLAGLETLLVEAGLVTAEELASGRSAGRAEPQTEERVLRPDRVTAGLRRGSPVEMSTAQSPKFNVGDHVRVANQHPTGHTRAPRYVRGRTGQVHEAYGAHVFPDQHALGVREGHHLYSVRFDHAELWGRAESGAAAVYVDLWEEYLEPLS